MCILYYHANLMIAWWSGREIRQTAFWGISQNTGTVGVDIEPIGGLYKTQVRETSRYMGIPAR